MVSAEPPELSIGDPPVSRRLYIEKIDPVPQLQHVERIEIRGAAGIVRSNVPLRYGQLQETTYSWGETIFEGRPTVVVTTKGAKDTTIVSIRTL